MGYYKFTGEIFRCDIAGNKIQLNIIDVTTGVLHMPVVTSKNKNYSKFWNNSVSKTELFFTAELIDASYTGKNLRNITFYEKEVFLNNFVEFFI